MRKIPIKALAMLTLAYGFSRPTPPAVAGPVLIFAATNAMTVHQEAARNAERESQNDAFLLDDLAQAYKRDTEGVIANAVQKMADLRLSSLPAESHDFRKSMSKKRRQMLEENKASLDDQKKALEACRTLQSEFLERVQYAKIMALHKRLREKLAGIYLSYRRIGLNLRQYNLLQVLDNEDEQYALYRDVLAVQEEIAAMETSQQRREAQILEGHYQGLGGLKRRLFDSWRNLGVGSQAKNKAKP